MHSEFSSQFFTHSSHTTSYQHSDLFIVLQDTIPDMKADLLCIVLFASALTVTVQSAPHEKHESLSGWSQTSEEMDHKFSKLNKDHDYILPTFFFFEASSPELENKDISKKTPNGGHGTNKAYSVDLENSAKDGRSIPVLVNEEMLAQLIKDSEEKQHDLEHDTENNDGETVGKVSDTNDESVGITPKSKNDGKEHQEQNKEKDAEEEVGSSTDSEIPLDLDYAANILSTKSQNTKMEEKKSLAIKFTAKENDESELPTVMEDYDTQSSQDYEDTYDGHEEKTGDQAKSTESLQDEQILLDPETDKGNTDESTELEEKEFPEETEKGVDTKESINHDKEKGKIQIKSKRLSKAQSNQALNAEQASEHSQNREHEKESEITQSLVQRKNRKWASLLGRNPVQIRAAVDLFPRIRPTAHTKFRIGTDSGQEASLDSCKNFHCKRGKRCQLNDKKKPSCVCQEPADCPQSSLSHFDHVCGTDNQTYDSSCQLFATKCSLEGSKKGHRLHLDYTGSCKVIPPCLMTELIHFPLRMRDWLKNVLLQLYDQDFLTAKQRSRVQKIYENEMRLNKGDHPIELLTQDFEKNYNMYIYPVHWQFAQMDQHPTDRFLSHSELAPLRAPLVPMEHCTSVFFHGCDTDKDKLLSFREWCQCFGIKDEDMDTNLLF
ncbi:hypothetical protein HF521_008953 [Silurus meridionalis]|uniref:Kazal-like domain-containing protein n=2 Tax=Silurus meridionalis TaxID=175797 RepID=A0A8T0BRY8_SILME|nr:hypothetical protein HF521_008953 [Silurus meridionalis]